MRDRHYWLGQLAKFTGREAALKGIIRYHMYPVMFYRTTLWEHSLRVSVLLEHFLPLLKKIYPRFDSDRAIILALVHDDAEIVTGDVQAGHKSLMTKAQLQEVHDKEVRAIQNLAKRFPPKIGDYNYAELLLDVLNLHGLETETVKYLDISDSFGEALHEVYAGNTSFSITVQTKYGSAPLPTDHYLERIPRYRRSHPNLTQFFRQKSALLQDPPPFDAPLIVQKPIDDPNESTGYAPYDEWKRLLLKSGEAAVIEGLTRRREAVR